MSSFAATLTPGKLWGLRRMADRKGRFKMLAIDQRPPIEKPIAEKRGVAKAPFEDVARFKTMLLEALQGEASAVLTDPHFTLPHALTRLDPAKGLIVTLEDSAFEDTDAGRLSAPITDWSAGKIKRIGGDAVKVLAWYRPDLPVAVRRHQEDFAKRIGEACAKADIPYLFELLVYPLKGDPPATGDYQEMQGKHTDHVLESVRIFAHADYGIDVFKLESPVASAALGKDDAKAQKLFDEMGRLAGRPWVMLSAGAGMDVFRRVLTHAFKAGASGYLAGRAIWAEPFKSFPDWDAIAGGLASKSVPYMREINALCDATAKPLDGWLGGAFATLPVGDGFRKSYKGF